MKNLGTILAAVFLGLVLVLYMCTYQVRSTEVAIQKTWGKVSQNAVREPGLKFKWPTPIQSVVIYDQRIRILEDRTEETRTEDGKNLLVTTYTLWRIADPITFHTNFPGGVEDGQSKLRTTIVTSKHAVIGQRKFEEFVSTNPEERKLREIEDQIRDTIAANSMKEYGIEIVGFGIKKLGLPQSVTATIFDNMKSNELKKAARYQAEGKARATEILADARASRDRILAAARKKVAAIESEAQRVVSGYYKEFAEHPELRIFLDKLRTVSQALRERTTLIITHKQSPWDVFDETSRRAVPRGQSSNTSNQPAGKKIAAGQPD